MAKAKQLPLTKKMAAIADARRKLVGNQRDRGRTELMAIRESIKAQGRGVKSNVKVQTLLDRLEQYGDDGFERHSANSTLLFKESPAIPPKERTRTCLKKKIGRRVSPGHRTRPQGGDWYN